MYKISNMFMDVEEYWTIDKKENIMKMFKELLEIESARGFFSSNVYLKYIGKYNNIDDFLEDYPHSKRDIRFSLIFLKSLDKIKEIFEKYKVEFSED